MLTQSRFKLNGSLILSSTAVGVLLGFPVISSLMGEKLIQEPVATLWGSALGAIAAVAGAFWVSDRQIAQQRRSATALVSALFFPSVESLRELSTAYGDPSSPLQVTGNREPGELSADEWRIVHDRAAAAIEAHEKFRSRVHRYEGALSVLSATSLHMVLDLETELDEIMQGHVKTLAEGIRGQGLLSFGGAAYWDSRHALWDSKHKTAAYMTILSREA
jgi:hypothetical protein